MPDSSVYGKCPEVQGSVGSSSSWAPAFLLGPAAGGDMAKDGLWLKGLTEAGLL